MCKNSVDFLHSHFVVKKLLVSNVLQITIFEEYQQDLNNPPSKELVIHCFTENARVVNPLTSTHDRLEIPQNGRYYYLVGLAKDPTRRPIFENLRNESVSGEVSNSVLKADGPVAVYNLHFRTNGANVHAIMLEGSKVMIMEA